MRIYSMTATFGKLEHETLTLEPGLNIIEAPNEWGKTTWCAFLVTMLYGLDTRAKTTKTALADKERYAPWSGSPMSGRMDLRWNGRDITIERWTKGRTLLGEFRAYETGTGAALPELTGANCGEMLLGVEKSVFLRSGFLKLAYLPVTQDESLRRRLNALVTTGDESGAGDALAAKLKDLKNKVRHNRTGLLPQAEAELASLEGKQAELESLKQQSRLFSQRLEETRQRLRQLENHQDALRYQEALRDAQQVESARQKLTEAEQQLEQAKQDCAWIPAGMDVEQVHDAVDSLRRRQERIRMELEHLQPKVHAPTPPEAFEGMEPAEALAQARTDGVQMAALRQRSRKPSPLPLLIALVLLAAGAGLWLAEVPFGYLALLPGLAVLVWAGITQYQGSCRVAAALADIRTLEMRYGSGDPRQWLAQAQQYQAAAEEYAKHLESLRRKRQEMEKSLQALDQEIETLCGGISPDRLDSALRAKARLEDAAVDYNHAKYHYLDLVKMAKQVQPPAYQDSLTLSAAETDRQQAEALAQSQLLQQRLGQYAGRMEALGQETQLAQKIDTLRTRIAKLEDHYAALEYAQNALAEATAELQRRFAPKIAARAQTLFSRLTGGRYDRFTLSEDLSVNAGAAAEDTLRTAQWRSDGTVDQLYLALRLAVSEELTPDAPLILDDALVRFDDKRLKTALNILREESEQKQVILFTCQSREKNM